MSETLGLGRNAVIMKGDTAIAYAESYDWAAEADIIKIYAGGSLDPAILEYGNKTYTITLNRAVVSQSFWSDLSSGTKLTLKIRPHGSGAGKMEFTFSDCVIRSVSGASRLNDVVRERIVVEAKGMTVGTQT
ncbi:MAG: hypothetical protein QW334_00255 [Thermofilum sp.]